MTSRFEGSIYSSDLMLIGMEFRLALKGNLF